MRDRRKIITLDTDSALALMQEIYNDIVEQKNIASLIVKKMQTFMKEAEDMSMIGPVIEKQQKILQDCSAKKLDLVKLQGALIKQGATSGNGNGMGTEKIELSPEDRKILEKLIEDKDEGKNEQDNGENYKA
jgi:isochorismate hydrolase